MAVNLKRQFTYLLLAMLFLGQLQGSIGPKVENLARVDSVEHIASSEHAGQPQKGNDTGSQNNWQKLNQFLADFPNNVPLKLGENGVKAWEALLRYGGLATPDMERRWLY